MGVTRIVFVLGMHRSGTSAAAAVVNALGLEVNADDDLLAPDEGNPQGYWESQSLIDLNDEVLAATGRHWSRSPRLDPGWHESPELAPLRARAAELFAARFRGGTWVWKDPRNCLTLPFWLAAFDVEPTVVLVHRSPLEVAGSLQRRDGFDLHHGVALWERYVRAGLLSAAGLPAFVSSYEDLLERPGAWAGELAAFLASRGLPVREAAAADADALVDPALRRVRSAPAELAAHPLVLPEHVELTHVLDGLRGTHAALAAPALPEETGWADRVLAGEVAVAELRRRVGDLEHEVDAARRDAEAARATADELLGSRTFRYTAPLRRLAGRLIAQGTRPR